MAAPSLLRAVLGVLAVGLCAGCPAEQYRIEISEDGMKKVIVACASGETCGKNCCPKLSAKIPKESAALYAQLHVVTVPADATALSQGKVRAQSPCMKLRLACDIEADAGAVESLAYCLALQLNDEIADAIPEGLGFDGMDDPNDVSLVLSLHRRSAEEDARCQAEEVFAAAGLSERVPGSKTYDITCASCSGGARNALSSTPPCVGACFASECAALLGGK
ncbi:MAG: hypothetical protein HY744_23305 [Deltaproteobacteria bacterium]|nr:hypothetical protein [Deltaproteobacteria bacterium]